MGPFISASAGWGPIWTPSPSGGGPKLLSCLLQRAVRNLSPDCVLGSAVWDPTTGRDCHWCQDLVVHRTPLSSLGTTGEESNQASYPDIMAIMCWIPSSDRTEHWCMWTETASESLNQWDKIVHVLMELGTLLNYCTAQNLFAMELEELSPCSMFE